MNAPLDRRDFSKVCALAGGAIGIPFGFTGCAHAPQGYADLPKGYDIFAHVKQPTSLLRFELSNLKALNPSNDRKTTWLLNCMATIFQALVNREEPRVYLTYPRRDIDWLANYKAAGHEFTCDDVTDFRVLLDRFKSDLDGYIVADSEMLDTVNIGQTWGSLENWMVVLPEQESLVREVGLEKRQDLRGRWMDRVDAYQWAFDNLFARCSKHVLGSQCTHFPIFPSGETTIRDFLVHNKAFTFDLSAAFRQRREYRLFSRICAELEFPSGVWGWHCTRDHEHWAVARASRESAYTICALGMPNLSVHGGFRAGTEPYPPQKKPLKRDCVAKKNKIYVAFMMSDGDSLWVMNSLQLWNWGEKRRGTFPVAWGVLPLFADIAPAIYRHYLDHMNPHDYMIAGPSGAGYTYTHMHENPRKFLRYSKHYMQRCGLEIVNVTNWNDDTNWQEVDLPWFNPILKEELDNCVGYVRGMGESAFEPHYDFEDKPYVFCGEGLHIPDKDDVATMKNFIDANPNRPLFIYCLTNISVGLERMERIVKELGAYDIEYVRLDDYMELLKSAYKQGLITHDLYPNREGNAGILTAEAPGAWQGTRDKIENLVPVLEAKSEAEALRALNADETGLALGQEITDEDKADILLFALCENMFSMVKNVLNLKGVYVNPRAESIETFLSTYGDWEGAQALRFLIELWQDWDRRNPDWSTAVRVGRSFLKLYRRADRLFPAVDA